MELEQLENILLSFAYKEDDEKQANIAFDKLYQEFSKFLYALVKKKLYQMGTFDEQIVSATVDNTFLLIYDKPPMNFKVKDGDLAVNSFKAYLSTVAKNELLRLFKEYYDKNLVLESNIIEPAFEETEIETEISQSLNSKNMQDALNTLSERDREILWTLYLYQEDGKNTPSSVLDTICQKFITTKDNIRQIKKRSEAKIIEYFSKCSQLKPVKNVK
jgi:RNA polymerase sigma factor (sigma-70 family)